VHDVVFIELPTRTAAERLLATLRPRRFAWLQSSRTTAHVGTLLSTDVDDLAHLLRSVQAWLQRSGLARLQRSGLALLSFELDGRTYELEPQRAQIAA
jgi:hypothetical protein